MQPKWRGPYEITELKDNKLAQLKNPKTRSVLANLINIDRLKLYKKQPEKIMEEEGNENQPPRAKVSILTSVELK